MTELDSVLADLSAKIDRLSTRAVSALFASCAEGLRPSFSAWAALRHADTEHLLEQALATAFAFAREGVIEGDPVNLLSRIEEATPPGDSPDAISSTAAQDCWICADVAIRVIVDRNFNAGPSIEYALEPAISAATERLFGVSQLSSGPEEVGQLSAVLREPDVMTAIDFCRSAIELLIWTTEPQAQDIDMIRKRATGLLP